jgi:diguanylate cyclase (GGDEF)-like protein/PAS domain S-box-containing protein
MSLPRLRLLLIEDSLSDAALVVTTVRRQGFDLVYERVDTAEGMLAALDRDVWDVIIADHGMPSFGAQAALALIRAEKRDLPVIVVTGTIRDEEAVDYIKDGASDYLLKDRLSRLGDAVRRALTEKALRARQRRAEGELRYQADLLNAVNQAVIATDLDGTIRYWNRFAETLYGWSAEEVVGTDRTQLTAGLANLWQVGEIEPSLRHGRGWSGECTVRRRDGTTFPVLVTDSPILDANGALVGMSNISIDISARIEMEAALRHQALHDSLTELPNRSFLNEHLAALLRTAARSEQMVSLLLLDLDRFNEVNDTLGHQAGDQVLRQVAARLQSALGTTETIARLGGDEFAVVLPAADAETARTMARQVVAEFDRHFTVEQHQLDLAVSVGIATFPHHGGDARSLLQHADVAMYVAKRGHLGVAVYDATQDRHTVRRLGLVHDLRKAIRDGDLIPYFQPKVALSGGRFSGAELLLRWPHPTHGFIPPDEFIPLAEQTGLVIPMTEWVLLTALRQASEWSEAGYAIPIAINISTRSLQDQKFPDLVAGHLRRHGVDPSFLTLEITESSLMAEPRRAREILVHLHALGLRIAIDDFGTGYSSLGYLKELPVDEVKIDKTFVMGMGAGNQKDLAIVRSVIAVAHALDLSVVAEGVEDAATFDLLGSLGCDIAQGYLLSRPCPAADLALWYRSYLARIADDADRSK